MPVWVELMTSDPGGIPSPLRRRPCPPEPLRNSILPVDCRGCFLEFRSLAGGFWVSAAIPPAGGLWQMRRAAVGGGGVGCARLCLSGHDAIRASGHGADEGKRCLWQFLSSFS